MNTNEPSRDAPVLAADSVLPRPHAVPTPDALTARIRRRRARARVAAQLFVSTADDDALGGTSEHLAQIHADR